MQVFLDLTEAIVASKEGEAGSKGGKKKKRNIIHGFQKLPRKLKSAMKGKKK